MNRLLRIYQYLAPAILTPLSCFLWWREYGNAAQLAVAWGVPIAWAYVVPAVGTNVRKVWEFDVRWKLGRFRPHHGFVFGSATSTLAWLVHGQAAQDFADVARFGLVLCSVLGFWNLLYEIKALKIGLLRVYNQPWARGEGPAAIAADYSPWIFGGFGFAYGISVALLERQVAHAGVPGAAHSALYALAALAACIALPILGFVRHSLRTHGCSGTRPAVKE